eukprot:XP_011667063.1 PREDICTED: uncharacterized protein LOC105439591 [Strongylocentrotus purpuratus]
MFDREWVETKRQRITVGSQWRSRVDVRRMLQCQYLGNDDSRSFTVAADAPGQSRMSSSRAERVFQNVSLDVNDSITCKASDTWRGIARFSFEIVCQVEFRIILRVSPMDIDNGIDVTVFPDEEEIKISSNTRPSNYPIFLLSENNVLEIKAKYPNAVMQNKRFMLSARAAKVIEQIDPNASDSSCQVNQASQESDPTTIVSCPTHSSYDIVLISFDDDNERSFKVICWEFDVNYQRTSMRASCSRMPGKLQSVTRAVRHVYGNLAAPVMPKSTLTLPQKPMSHVPVHALVALTQILRDANTEQPLLIRDERNLFSVKSTAFPDSESP